ncbi:hypothetical protein [Aquisphaera insulae]|uniref:hypothetical protein n=1 Tax=Aquisphaera insulae TaxID=2712864 RepID=UPI0013EDA9BE|nr:hypothetical protein [Aquisphaera insulae]
MKRFVRLGVWFVLVFSSMAARAHPGSGIVVDRSGRIYFVDTGVGVWTIDTQGRLARHEGEAFHWLAIDRRGGLSARDMPRDAGGELPVIGRDPTLILSSDFPIAVGPDGVFYYPRAVGDRVRIMRLRPGEKPEVFAMLPPVLEVDSSGREKAVPWIHGLAAAADGSLYYSELAAVRRIAPDGKIAVVADKVKVPSCDRPPAAKDEHLGPALRGLDVRPDGTVFVAASACGTVLRIAPDGTTSVALRTEGVWSPTAVVLAGEDLLVLEYWSVKATTRQAWIPRVRKLSGDGKVTLLATVERR